MNFYLFLSHQSNTIISVACIFVAMLLIAFAVLLLSYERSKKDSKSRGKDRSESPEIVAGRAAEKRAKAIIQTILHSDDILFSNVELSYDGQKTELDNVVLNRYGITIIEVKYYSGCLIGKENDYEWTKHHFSKGHVIYTKKVKNPLKQVKRQIHILAHYMRYYGIDLWVEGYVMIIGARSPVETDRVLSTVEDIDRAIHTPRRTFLNNETINSVKELFSEYC